MAILRAALVVGLVAGSASAQILSPGPLARSHAEIEGITNCTRCHNLGKKVDGQLCFACHAPIQKAVASGRGLHGKAAKAGQPCAACHHEHRGAAAALTDWKGPRERFDHAATGYPLTGKHARAKCEACHDPRLVTDPELRARLQKQPASTHLGVPTACASCHFDEHRGQLGRDCQRCHDTAAFVPARGFDHDVAHRLLGAHKKARCDGCHPRDPDPEEREEFPAPVHADAFARYRPVADERCVACHEDVHRGAFGADCKRCHGYDSWTHLLIARKDIAFHQDTRFPLRGLHQAATCEGCHPRDKNGGLKTKGVPFERCTDCHLDAHFGQLAAPAGGLACERCHDENGFLPARYQPAWHAETRYPLRGGHEVAACNGCHVQDPTAFAEPSRRGPPGTRRPSFARFELPVEDRCEGCHKDPHAAQFASAPAKPCASCHEVASFATLHFVHDRDSAFPLRGKHAQARCDACHRREGEAAVAYRGVPARCVACHLDPHLGQLGDDCARCHGEDAFAPSRFDHASSTFTDFALTGRHAPLACAGCHPKLAVGTRSVVWYHGVPRRCEGCHEDFHAREGRQW